MDVYPDVDTDVDTDEDPRKQLYTKIYDYIQINSLWDTLIRLPNPPPLAIFVRFQLTVLPRWFDKNNKYDGTGVTNMVGLFNAKTLIDEINNYDHSFNGKPFYEYFEDLKEILSFMK